MIGLEGVKALNDSSVGADIYSIITMMIVCLPGRGITAHAVFNTNPEEAMTILFPFLIRFISIVTIQGIFETSEV